MRIKFYQEKVLDWKNKEKSFIIWNNRKAEEYEGQKYYKRVEYERVKGKKIQEWVKEYEKEAEKRMTRKQFIK